MKRVLTAALLIPPSICLIFWAPFLVFIIAAVALAFLCYHEYLGLTRAYGLDTLGPLGYAAGLAVLVSPDHVTAILTVSFLAIFALSLRAADVAKILPQSAAISFGLVYVFGAWRCGVGLKEISPHWMLYALVLNWIGDTCAYYGGRAFGRHKLAPRLSPGKTWEGTAASVTGSVAFGILYLGRFAPQTPLWEVVALSVVANAAGQIGDLCESAMKRGAGVKDSSHLLPGHGGWLDRLDSSLFSMPVVYFWLSQPWRG